MVSSTSIQALNRRHPLRHQPAVHPRDVTLEAGRVVVEGGFCLVLGLEYLLPAFQQLSKGEWWWGGFGGHADIS